MRTPVRASQSQPLLCTGLDVIRKEACSGVRLCWVLEEPKGPKGNRHVIMRTPVRVRVDLPEWTTLLSGPLSQSKLKPTIITPLTRTSFSRTIP